MDIEQINALVKNGESHQLEFKKSTGQLRAVCETVCAFLNGHGGTVLIGVTDNGKIVGQEISDSTRQEIAKEINKIEPSVQIPIDYVPLDMDKCVIVLKVSQGHYKPYAYDGRPFHRSQSTIMKMSQHSYEQLLVERGHLNYSWDELPARNYDISFLDREEILRSVRQGIEANRISEEAARESIESILERLKLLKDGNLTNAALVLFVKEVWPDYPQCHIKMARFKGTRNTGEFLDNQSFYGNAFKVLSEAGNFIRRHLLIASFFQEDRFERIDKPTLPVLAVREALINSICHRDYSDRSTSIALAIYDDRLEIWNYGSLPRGLSIDDLKKTHQSHPRNKLISEIIYSRGMIEKWGTGINKMVDICSESGVPEPEFNEYSGGLSVTFKYKESIGEPVIEKAPFNQLTRRQQDIIELLTQNGELSPKKIMEMLKEPIAERTLRRELEILKNLVIVETKGYGRATVWFLSK
ncbi:MAG: ATP-binding protein [Alphaproteobacteria bacterium]